MKIVNFISSWAASRAPILACLLSSSLLFRRRSFSALFCSPRPSLLPPRMWWLSESVTASREARSGHRPKRTYALCFSHRGERASVCSAAPVMREVRRVMCVEY